MKKKTTTATTTAVKIRFSAIVESLFSITLGTHKDSSQIVQHTYSLAHTNNHQQELATEEKR